ncbi:hypothetical protein SAMD00019534_067240 [Acytostelium subglobosum LB1]|uniref:hypothetical protein n=1 Tax=Acytostelium subglobosum LB1 TaxID=1410327 RepID=UPI000644F1F9|nr:hypothetical protein SAMD00019534_067240 [Acytostelium subglobosum LB1]GAM23549.1 hypothetical protein SAMD00019534_067240 [Acytostelium subglobosum LB1]|eukprot:XP_012753290.1 hypothetical protein SAMD00019534_067240 [Acytostelium subglobosum LB1]
MLQSWREQYEKIEQVLNTTSETEILAALMDRVGEGPDRHADVTVALLYAVLVYGHNQFWKYLTIVTKDSLQFCCQQLKKLINDRFQKLNDFPRAQLLWLLSELISANHHDSEAIAALLMRHIYSGNTTPKNITLATNLLSIISTNKTWLYNRSMFIPTALYTFLRLLQDHLKPQFNSLREAETTFCLDLLRNKFNESITIGRDLVRVLHYLSTCKLPEFEQLWKDLNTKPASFSSSFADLSSIMRIPTPKHHLQFRLSPEMETQVLFILKEVRFGYQKRYQQWFVTKHLPTPESESLIPDLIRYICCCYHPPNHVLCSDIVPRWAIIGWLLKHCKDQWRLYAKQALFYDWLYYDGKLDSIMNIEPALLLMACSIKKYSDMTVDLVEFILYLLENHDKSRKDMIKNGINTAFANTLDKSVVPSLEPIFSTECLSPALYDKVKVYFSHFMAGGPQHHPHPPAGGVPPQQQQPPQPQQSPQRPTPAPGQFKPHSLGSSPQFGSSHQMPLGHLKQSPLIQSQQNISQQQQLPVNPPPQSLKLEDGQHQQQLINKEKDEKEDVQMKEVGAPIPTAAVAAQSTTPVTAQTPISHSLPSSKPATPSLRSSATTPLSHTPLTSSTSTTPNLSSQNIGSSSTTAPPTQQQQGQGQDLSASTTTTTTTNKRDREQRDRENSEHSQSQQQSKDDTAHPSITKKHDHTPTTPTSASTAAASSSTSFPGKPTPLSLSSQSLPANPPAPSPSQHQPMEIVQDHQPPAKSATTNTTPQSQVPTHPHPQPQTQTQTQTSMTNESTTTTDDDKMVISSEQTENITIDEECRVDVPDILLTTGNSKADYQPINLSSTLKSILTNFAQQMAKLKDNSAAQNELTTALSSYLNTAFKPQFSDTLSPLSLFTSFQPIHHLFKACSASPQQHHQPPHTSEAMMSLLKEMYKLEPAISYNLLIWQIVTSYGGLTLSTNSNSYLYPDIDNTSLLFEHTTTSTPPASNGIIVDTMSMGAGAAAAADNEEELYKVEKLVESVTDLNPATKNILSVYQKFINYLHTGNSSISSSSGNLNNSNNNSYMIEHIITDCKRLQDEQSLMFYVLPTLYRYMPSFTIGNSELMMLVLDYIDPKQLYRLCNKLAMGEFRMFGNASLALVDHAFHLESFEQTYVWQLLLAEDRAQHTLLLKVFPVIAHRLDPLAHSEILLQLSVGLKETNANSKMLSELISLSPHFHPFSLGVFATWQQRQTANFTSTVYDLISANTNDKRLLERILYFYNLYFKKYTHHAGDHSGNKNTTGSGTGTTGSGSGSGGSGAGTNNKDHQHINEGLNNIDLNDRIVRIFKSNNTFQQKYSTLFQHLVLTPTPLSSPLLDGDNPKKKLKK